MNKPESFEENDYPEQQQFEFTRGNQRNNAILGALNVANFGYQSKSKAIYGTKNRP